ncbi:GDP-mannose 4,6-dehydratase [Runella sp. MFBS21]|uniref:GDP-mannose 4,6-dehydratase n=1 Tax=Runella sp. MFBS21 TaxID=3034018 RepID=UPI0023F80F03|nr:GDP-mannose 4,6-dehydratase [Runella sp. MFBS21]MDF7820404.1 GDP-mannose 4,6-dehydratase [Runella sp. MFBS21]
MSSTAIITGITGQDGAYLSRFLLEKGYKVIGIVRSYTSSDVRGLRLLGIQDKVELVECDLTDLSQVISVIGSTRPTEVYNLAAQSSVALSFKQPIGTINFNIISVLNLLEAIRLIKADTKFYQASSSEIFGGTNQLPITEQSAINPISPYSISKASAYWITKNYREAYHIFSCSGFLFNHESYLRSENFFIKKIIRESIRIQRGVANQLEVGNIDIKRDFGWAPKYVEAMYLMLQRSEPEDYVICSNTSVSLRSIIEYVFTKLKISMECLKVRSDFYRPTEIPDIYGSNSKARQELNWQYDLSFFDVLDILIEEELEYVKKQQL